MLTRLINTASFDPNAISQHYLHVSPDGFKYHYWLPVVSRISKWLERHTAERYILSIAIFGLFLNALFGLLSCLIGAAQLYVAILTLKVAK